MFGQMLREIARGRAKGVVIHKIDRSARNLRDWADLNDLMDQGAEVHFAHDALDLSSRGGRLSADIQAVVAADFIRNLRDETRKGIYGRLKQGMYPFRAPIGYLDQGRAKPKVPDPATAHLIRDAFNLYATGEWNFIDLQSELERRGLRNRTGGRLSLNGLTTVLNNPFYMGLIHLRSTNELFQGAHTPLISKTIYDRVQYVLRGGKLSGGMRHDFLFRKAISCGICGYHLVGERQKGRVYYRCHRGSHAAVREDAVDEEIEQKLATLRTDIDIGDFRDLVESKKDQELKQQEQKIAGYRLMLGRLDNRLTILTDLLIDGSVDREMFEQRKTALLHERVAVREEIEKAQAGATIAERVFEKFELSNTAYLLYKSAIPDEKRELLKKVSSNLIAIEKNIAITLHNPLERLANFLKLACGDLYRDAPRTRAEVLFEIVQQAMLQEEKERFGSSSIEKVPEVPMSRRA